MIWPFRRREKAPRPAPLDAAAIVRRARRLRFRVRPDAVSQLAGAYHGARPGIGLTFAELRAYEPGDDVRHLDWNVTARQGRPFVRRFVEERALCLWLVVDVSASMRFGPERKTKADRAAQAAALLATAAVQNGDRAGLILVSDRIEVELAPAGGVRHLSQLVRALVATPTTSPKTKLSVGLARVRRTARRAMVVVISDFITEEPVATWRARAPARHDRVAGGRSPRGPTPGRRTAGAGGCRTRRHSHRRRVFQPGAQALRRDLRRSLGGLPAPVCQFGHPGVHDDDRHRSDRTADRALLQASDPPRPLVNDATSQRLVPPQPNLGPEPWQDPHPLTRMLPWFLLLTFLALAFFIGRRYWEASARSRRDRPAPGDLTDSNPSPRDRLVGLSASIREALTVPFGTAGPRHDHGGAGGRLSTREVAR